jgi:hypothetical protein
MRQALGIPRSWRALCFVAVAAIAVQLLLLPEPAFAERIVAATSDKVVHASVFGGIAFLLWAGFDGCRAARVFALVVAIGALDETHQMFVPGRDPDLNDLNADGLGAVGVIMFHEALTSPRARAPDPLTCGD